MDIDKLNISERKKSEDNKVDHTLASQEFLEQQRTLSRNWLNKNERSKTLPYQSKKKKSAERESGFQVKLCL